jgi:type VI secretion system secreted protein VgrG
MAVVQIKANESRYFFVCGSLPQDTFHVAEFSGVERLSSPYHFDITLISKNANVELDKVINKPATFFMKSGEFVYPYSGVITEFRLLDNNMDFTTYRVHLVPRMWLTTLNVQSRITVQTTLVNAVKSVLSEADVQNINLVSSNIKNNFEYEYLVQYQESDFNFINRLLESAGAWYFFEENRSNSVGKSEEKLIITGESNSFKNIESPVEVTYKEVSGLDGDIAINNLTFKRQIVSGGVFVKDYNYRDPASDLVGNEKNENGSVGSVYEYGGGSKNVTAVQNAAKILSNRVNSQAMALFGDSNCIRFRSGYRFKLKNHFRKDLTDQEYVLTAVHHSGSQKGGSASYKNTFECIPSSIANKYGPEKRASIPKVPGLLTAKIEAEGSDYATLDDKGRYKVRLHFDLTNAKNMGSSKHVRLAQPYSGSQYGMHFPQHKDTEMLIACIDGDPNRPVGIGTIPNANNMSPVVSANKQQNIIRTAGGNELLMDDTDAKQKLHLMTKAKNTMEFNDELKHMMLQSTDKNLIKIDDKNKIVQIVSSKHTISLSYADDTNITISTEKKNFIKIDDKNENITIKTAGGHGVQLDDKGKKIVLADGQGKSTVTLDGNDGLILDTKGKITITAQQDIELKGANIKMSSSQGKIEAKATTDVSISGVNVNVKGNAAVKLEGAQLSAKGSATVAVQGAKVEVKADAMLKLSGGAMAELSGGGMTTIKGGVVMIN